MNKILFLWLFWYSNIFSYSFDFKIEGPKSIIKSFALSQDTNQNFKFEYEEYSFDIEVKKVTRFCISFEIRIYHIINNEKKLLKGFLHSACLGSKISFLFEGKKLTIETKVD